MDQVPRSPPTLALTATTTLTAAGGTYPYSYAIDASVIAAHRNVDQHPRYQRSVRDLRASTTAGTYTVNVQATDSSTSALQGIARFTVVVNLVMTNSTPATITHGATAATIATV